MEKASETRLLGRAQVEQLISVEDTVEIVEKTFRGLGDGTVINPTKVTLNLGETAPWPPYKGFMNAMPAYVGWQDSAGLKWVGGFLNNRDIGLPYLTGMILLIDPRTGRFRCVCEGAHITNLRTGAQTAVTLKHLHRSPSIRIGLYGAGAQGRFQTRAVAACFEIEELKVYDIRREAAESFAADMADAVKGRIIVAETPEEAASADAVITVTQAEEPFLRAGWIAPATVVFPMGSYQECEDEVLLGADRIIVDHMGQALHRGALGALGEKGAVSEDDIWGTVGEIVAGKKKVPDGTAERTVCCLVGTGAMDVSVATVVLQRAEERGIGEFFRFA